MAIQALLPYALAAIGGYQGYRGAKEQGASGLGRLFGAAAGAYGGYNLGQVGGFAANAGFQQPAFLNTIPGFRPPATTPTFTGSTTLPGTSGGFSMQQKTPEAGGSLLDILRKKNSDQFSPGKVSAAIAAATYFGGAFDPAPVDIYTPGYNMSYLELARQRGNYKYIDPTTGSEKEYQSIYKPEEQGLGDRRIGAYSMPVQRLRDGGIAAVNYNEGGVNYLPSKMTHDENDATNYVRATGYVEDGAGVGDKDEDTMLAQLADGEFVTRADGVLGAGIIAGANPNSMKDMREKGAQYFYEQQKRYKRVFDLLKEANGDSKQKEN